MKTVLLIGGCGSGKTWVMQELIKTLKLTVRASFGMVSYIRDSKIMVLGKYDGSTFQGSDRLSMAVMRDVPEFVEEFKAYKFCVCEGDRFTNKPFIEATKPYIIKITDDGSAGRKKRGSSQTERQIQSIATRIANIDADVEVKDSSAALKIICKLVAGK